MKGDEGGDTERERRVGEIEIWNDAEGDEVGDVGENNSLAEIRDGSAENYAKRECTNFRAFADVFHENISEYAERDEREQDNPNARKFDAESEIGIFDELQLQKRQDFARDE